MKFVSESGFDSVGTEQEQNTTVGLAKIDAHKRPN